MPATQLAPTREDYAAISHRILRVTDRITQLVDQWLDHSATSPEPHTASPAPKPTAPATTSPDLKALSTASLILQRATHIVQSIQKISPIPVEEVDPFPYSAPEVLRKVFGDEPEECRDLDDITATGAGSIYRPAPLREAHRILTSFPQCPEGEYPPRSP
jgi:hypothetical protein